MNARTASERMNGKDGTTWMNARTASKRMNGKDRNTWINTRTMNQNTKYGHYKTGWKKGQDIIK
jgi:hypothetical protein